MEGEQVSKVRAQLAARRIISTLQLKPPIDLDVIVAHYGIELLEWDFPDYIDGMLRKEGGRWYIIVNRFKTPGRQRFTVAHEILHYALHKESRFCYRGLRDYREIEANVGAAELLMPPHYLKWWAVLKDFDTQELANHFGVSKQAMGYQLKRLGILHV
jgi:Zn-dependent peptidase ImmA (M78 family)